MRIANLNLMSESITQIFAKFLAVSMCLYLYLHLLTIAVSIDETTDNYRGSTLSLPYSRLACGDSRAATIHGKCT